MCPYFCSGISDLLRHLVRRHKHAASFIVHCNAKGCGASFRNHQSFKRHVKHKHASELRAPSSSHDDHDVDYDSQLEDPMDEHNNALDTSKAEATFSLKLKACGGISNALMQETILSVRELYQTRFDIIKQSLQGEALESVAHLLDASVALSEVDTKHKRDKYLEQKMGAVMPRPIVMGEHIARRKHKGKTKFSTKKGYGYVVPFLDNLQSFLSMPEVQSCLSNGPVCSDTFMTDVKDGCLLRQNAFLNEHPDALLFAAYNDAFELVNPIGSHTRRHKLSIFYYVLLNIPPEFRSKLSVIQLIAVAKSIHIKRYGTEPLLKDFLDGLQKLRIGVKLQINGREKVHHGLLAFFLGDTPAAQAAGGFKEGVGSARKPCRFCDAGRNTLRELIFESDCPEREEQEHRDRCESLDNLSKEAKLYWSREYGINGKSFLYSVPESKLTKCILHDPMHILLEGIDRLELRLLLIQLTQERKYLSLDKLNSVIDNFNYN